MKQSSFLQTLFFNCILFTGFVPLFPAYAVTPQWLSQEECIQEFVQCSCEEQGCLPAFSFQSQKPTEERMLRLKQGAWIEGCPLKKDDIRVVDLLYFDEMGVPKKGELVMSVQAVEGLRSVFSELFRLRFPIHKMQSVEAYGGNDDLSMEDNNTSVLNCRKIKGTKRWSEHSRGMAIDINPLWNPYVYNNRVEPPAGKDFVDRNRIQEGMIAHDDPVVQVFSDIGWKWGGHWKTRKDYQHFSSSGR